MSFRETAPYLVENSLIMQVGVFFLVTRTLEHIQNSSSTSANEKFSLYMPRCGINPA
jgi:hypothetical protein